LDTDLATKYANDARVKVQKSNSLDALPQLTGVYDCILIDGDHNWYTVFNELRLIRQRGLLRKGGMIFFHDVEWPYGRRDMYYQPNTIPAEYRHEYALKGMLRKQSKLPDSGGVNSTYWNAVYEGGPKNGVLTAIEDFVAEHASEYNFCRIKHHLCGLGILQYRRKAPSEDISFFLFRAKVWMFNLYRLVRSSLGDVKNRAIGKLRSKRKT
jgi:hypothetical protein